MRKLQRDSTLNVRAGLQGLAYVIICIMALIMVMGFIVIAVRFIVG